MRLAFSIAIHVHPEILLVDEILAVGDTDFQAKCFKKMNEYVKDTDITIVFVSHNMNQIEKFCGRTIYVNHSQIITDGNSEKAIKIYKKDNGHDEQKRNH
jgi:ABC-2 type transport system ATP-binding protein